MTAITVRRATPADGPAIIEMIEALLDYEHIGPMAEGAHERFLGDFSRPNPPFAAFIAEADGRPAGYAVVYETYSTLRARPRLFIEDIFAYEGHRGTPVGWGLFRAIVRHAQDRGCCLIEWQVLTWNQPAIDFYERAGATRDTEWYTYRLSEDAMQTID